MNTVILVLFLIIWCVVAFIRVRNGKPIETSSDEYIPVNRINLYERGTERNLKIAYAYLAGWMMKQNRRNLREKMQFVHLYFRSYFKGQDRVTEEMSDALRYETDVQSIARWMNRVFETNRTRRLDVLRFLVALAIEDGSVMQAEHDALKQLASLLHVPADELEALIASKAEQRFREERSRSDVQQPVRTESKRRRAITVLGLGEEFAPDELKKAYRNLAKQFHPDKFMQHTSGEREKAAATFREINEAYDYLSENGHA